jgi:adhesin/invasin
LSKSKVFLFTAALSVLFIPRAAPAQTAANISVVSGNGQLTCDGCPNTALPFFDPLVVKVTDASGNPVSNAQVSWSVAPPTIITSGAAAAIGTLVGGATTTTGTATGSSAVICNVYNSTAAEASGYSCNAYVEAQAASVQIGPIATVVTASIPNGNSVTFYLTQSPPLDANVVDTVYINAQLSPSSTIQPEATISGPVGSVYSGGSISVVVATLGGFPIPNVSVRFIPQSATQGGASVTCQTPSGSDADPGSVLTGTNGTANCVPVFGPTPSSTPENFDILVGGVLALQNPNNVNSYNGGLGSPAGDFSFGPFRATATAVTPGSITYVSGNQTALAGTAVANPLVAQVNDTNGNPLQGAIVTWTVSPSTAAIVSPASGATGSNGQAQTTVTLASSASGTVTVTASVAGLTTTVPFTITATQPLPAITGLSIVSGNNNQSAQEGAAFAQPLVVQVLPATVGARATVNFALGSGSIPAVLSASSAQTTSNGQASIGVTAGATAGTITVIASVAGATNVTPVTFNLTVTTPPPPISSTSFLNGAGFFPTSGGQQTALSPCGVGTLVVGSQLASTAFPATPNMYATPLGQTNGIAIVFPTAAGTSSAPILNITTASTGQQLITFQVPCEVTPSSATVTVTINGSNVTIPGVTVDPGAPGIFETISSDGVRRAVAVRANGTFVSPQNPAQPGEFITIYVTGVGPVIPMLATAQLPVSGVNVVPAVPGQVIVGLDSSGVGAVTVTASPELIGVYQVTFQVPANTTAGDHILAVGVTAEGNPTQFQQPGGSKLFVQ